jgi:hypothetical protein
VVKAYAVEHRALRTLTLENAVRIALVDNHKKHEVED